MTNPFTEHPHSAGQDYWQHLWFALLVAGRCFWIGVLATVHALFPFLATAAAGDRLLELAEEIRALRAKR